MSTDDEPTTPEQECDCSSTHMSTIPLKFNSSSVYGRFDSHRSRSTLTHWLPLRGTRALLNSCNARIPQYMPFILHTRPRNFTTPPSTHRLIAENSLRNTPDPSDHLEPCGSLHSKSLFIALFLPRKRRWTCANQRESDLPWTERRTGISDDFALQWRRWNC